MLIRTEKLVSKFFSKSLLLRNGFCQMKLKFQGLHLHLDKQKADLSFEIYQLILKKPDSLDLEEKSLHDMIMEKIYQKSEITNIKTSHQPKDLVNNHTQQQTFKYHEQARKPFIDMFEKGYKIDQQVFAQQRFTDAKVITDGPKKFIFHPTYLITNQVFKQLHWLQDSRKILTGHLGISKSVSVCLFWHLVKFMDEYRFQKGVTVSEQMIRVPKIVYLTLNKISQQQQQYFKRIILRQCPQIMKEYNYSNWSQYNGKLQNIQSFYRRYFSDLYVILVIDQINRAAQVGRAYQNRKQLFENIQRRRQDRQFNYANQLKKLQQNIALFFKFKQNIEFYIFKFGGFLGLSSMDLQHYVFKLINFNLASNTKVPLINFVKYPSELYLTQSLAQMADFFIFQMDQRVFKNLKNVIVSEVDLKEMKKLCFDEMKKMLETKYKTDKTGKKVLKKQYFYFTPLDIRLGVQKISQGKIDDYDVPIQKLKLLVEKTFTIQVNKYTQQYSKKLQEYFQKKNDPHKNNQRIKLMLKIYQYLAQKHRNQSQQSTFTQIKQIPVNALQSQIDQIKQFLNKSLFQLELDNQKIRLMLPSSLVIQVIKPCVKKYFSIYAEVVQQQADKMQGSLRGNYLQSKLLQVLNNGNIKLSIKEKIQTRLKKHQFDIKAKTYTFQHLQTSASKKPINLLNRFKETIKQMKENQIDYVALFPVGRNYVKPKDSTTFDLKNIVPNSKIIDFALINYSKQFDSTLIWLIDLTVSETEKSIEQKFLKFLKQFLQFSDKNLTQLSDIQKGLKIQLNYLVLGTNNDFKYKDFSKVLKTKFESQITLQTLDGSNVSKVVNLVGSESCLLKRIGYIKLNEDFDFEIKNKKSKKYEKAIKKLMKQQRQQIQVTKKRKQSSKKK